MAKRRTFEELAEELADAAIKVCITEQVRGTEQDSRTIVMFEELKKRFLEIL